jgi:hypothetical protein
MKIAHWSTSGKYGVHSNIYTFFVLWPTVIDVLSLDGRLFSWMFIMVEQILNLYEGRLDRFQSLF